MTAFFADVPKIPYGGPKSRNPLEFKHYNPDEIVGDKTMKEHLRFSVVYWHTFCNSLSDPFGVGTAQRPWDDGSNSVANAQRKVKVAFEFFEKLEQQSEELETLNSEARELEGKIAENIAMVLRNV